MVLSFIKRFCRDEDGAVTVDWVVLTAAVVSMGLAVVTIIQDGATDVSDGVGAQLSQADLQDIQF